MKSNKEFIKEIYSKADEYTKEREKLKKSRIKRITNIAAMFVIIFSVVVVSQKNQESQIYNKEEIIQETKISLQTIGNFENFCEIVKENYTENELKHAEGYWNSAVAEDLLQNNETSKNESLADRSSTNVQTQDVDEGDVVKLDDRYIYYISGEKIVIIDAKEAKSSKKVAEIDYKGKDLAPEELYIKGNKLVVIASKYFETECKTIEDIATYDIIRVDNKMKTTLVIYDISNRLEPKEIRKVEVEGNYISSRMIENNIYLASSTNVYTSDILRNSIEDLNEDNYKPKYTDTAISQEEKCIDYDKIYCFEEMEDNNYLILVGLNIENSQEADIQTFLGAGQYVYASTKNMYIATNNVKYDKNYNFIKGSTHILKFALNNGKFGFKAETDINGQVNNQFSMDESDQYFRIATTSGSLWDMDENTSNNLYVLDENLKEVGNVTNFGKEEKIYSVRYVGDKAYVVTFKQTDPLFVIDLSNPTKPEILGELKIPGYSTYLHPYDETHIIGFGYDTKDDGTRITINGLKMVMFDISDFNNPKVLFKIKIGDEHTYSNLEYDHKALLYSKERNIIAFPLTNYSRGNTNSRAAIYEIDLEKGFSLKGEISHITDKYDEKVERVVYLNNTFYTLSKKLIKAAGMNDLKVIKEIEI